MRFFGMDSFEQWLETELRNADTEASTVPAPRYAALKPPHHRGGVVRLLAGFGASKSALAASAVVALAAAGVVTGKAVTTGDPNPFDSNWGGTVTQQVQTCKGELGATQHGIGQCVRGKAKTHGNSVSGPDSNEDGPGFVPIEPPSPHPTGPPLSLSGAATNHPTPPPSPASPVPTAVAPKATPHGQGRHPTGSPSPQP